MLFPFLLRPARRAPVYAVTEMFSEPSNSVRLRNAGPAATSSDALAICAAAAFLCLVSVGLLVLTTPSTFADFATYEVIIEELRAASVSDIVTVEPFSRLFLYFCSTLNNNSAAAASVAHYANAAVSIVVLAFLALRYAPSWRNVLLLGALYSPLLVFVTIRATPAYLLVATAYLIRDRQPRKALAAAVLAVGFHMSAALALVPLLLTSKNRTSRISRGRERHWLDVWIVVAGGLLYVVVGGLTVNLSRLSGFLEGQSALAKYVAYVNAVDEAHSVMHLVYFVMTLGLMTVFLICRGQFCARDVRYMTLSFFIYSVLTVSPVAAFRESIFWMMPLVLVMPLHRYAHTALVSYVFCVSCVVLYAVEFYGVLVY